MREPPSTSTSSRRLSLRPAEQRVLLVLGDVGASFFAWLAAVTLWFFMAVPQPSWRSWVDFLASRPWWFYILPVLWVLLLVDLHDDSRAFNLHHTARGLMSVALLALALYLTAYFVLNVDRRVLPRVSVAAFIGFATLFVFLWRALYIRMSQQTGRRVLIVGAGRHGRALVAALQNEPAGTPLHLVGYIDDDWTKHGRKYHGLPVLGDAKALLNVAQRHQITDAVVAIVGEIRGELFQALLDLQSYGVEVTHLHAFYEEVYQRVPISHLGANWLLDSFVDEARKSVYYEWAKRALDIAAALVGLALLGAMAPFIALAIWLESGRPILFKQTRVGRHGRLFTVYKFRTMWPRDRVPASDGTTNRWADDEEVRRVTRVGRILRKSHLDEFPQFWNVLAGHMSVVGPRPEQPKLVETLEKTIPFYRARLLVKPGITGWAQIKYGYAASVQDTERKLEYDLYYIKHRNILLDLLIILRTLASVLGFRGH